jgi:hypothetical protein
VDGLNASRTRESNKVPSFTESISSRLVGSRFLEVNRNSAAYGRLIVGGRISVDRNGQLGPSGEEGGSRTSWIPDPRLYGPNWGAEPFNGEGISELPGAEYVDEHGVKRSANRTNSETLRAFGENTTMSPGGEWRSDAEDPIESETMHNGFSNDEGWVDLEKENGPGRDFDSDFNGLPPSSGPSKLRRRPLVPGAEAVPSTRRETFPLRRDRDKGLPPIPPPHLRLQHSQPFVRPLDGLNFNDLGHVYEDIINWRSQLKAINSQILDTQKQSYDDIAEGRNIRGWLIVGRGLRHLPGVQIIEGRAKEDIRWDVLQNERTVLDRMVFWTVVCIIAVLLAVGCKFHSGC